MVVAEANHRGDGEVQHLVRGAGPDAAQHRQQVVAAERGGELVLVQECSDRGCHLGLGLALGDLGGQAVEAGNVLQHAPKARAQQVAFLGKHAGEGAAAPFQRRCPVGTGRLDGERHLGGHRIDGQVLKELGQQGVGAVVEHQKAGVHAVRDAVQAQVHRVGMAAEMAASFQQADPVRCLRTGQVCRSGQPRNPRSDDSDALHERPLVDATAKRLNLVDQLLNL